MATVVHGKKQFFSNLIFMTSLKMQQIHQKHQRVMKIPVFFATI